MKAKLKNMNSSLKNKEKIYLFNDISKIFHNNSNVVINNINSNNNNNSNDLEQKLLEKNFAEELSINNNNNNNNNSIENKNNLNTKDILKDEFIIDNKNVNKNDNFNISISIDDNDNNIDLCIKEEGTPILVEVKGNIAIDPRGDKNSNTKLKIIGRWK